MNGILSIALALTLCIPGNAIAQDAGPHPATPSENVTVTGIKDLEAAVKKMVETNTVPTRVAEKLARWREGVCPITVGLRPEAVKFVTKRVKDVAAQVGAPVNDKDACPSNIAIVFTTAPQALLNNVRARQQALLGYHNNLAQAQRLATVTRPIQSWYTTGTQDMALNRTVDNGRCIGGGMGALELDVADVGGMSATPTPMFFPCANAYAVTGNRLGNGLSSELYRVVIVAEPAKLLDYEIGTLADYIAMLALSQIQPPDSCQNMPSILNLLVSGCDRTAKALTSGDIAYLRALYKITPTANFGVQRDEMKYQMDHALEARQ